jgi:hypothetical protein
MGSSWWSRRAEASDEPFEEWQCECILMIKMGLYRLPTFCGWGVGVAATLNEHSQAYRYGDLTPSFPAMVWQLVVSYALTRPLLSIQKLVLTFSRQMVQPVQ